MTAPAADLARSQLAGMTRVLGRPPTGDEVRARMRLLRDAASEMAAMVPREVERDAVRREG